MDRFFSNKIKELVDLSPNESIVLLVEGPRQVGKTTLITNTLTQNKIPAVEINLERDLVRLSQIEKCTDFGEFTTWLKDTLDFTPDGSKVLFIDEAQESKKLGHFVRFMKEEWQHTVTILTGSMMSRLFDADTRYPVGRVKNINVQPLTFFEFLAALGKDDWIKQIKNAPESITDLRHEALLNCLNDYIHVGGMPNAVKSFLAKKNPIELLREIFENYRQDFLRVFGENSGALFETVMRAVADHVGSPSNFAQAVSHQHPAYKKIPDIYSRLELWHMILVCPQRGPQPEGTTLYHPKRYLFDMGFLNLLRAIAVPQIHLIKTIQPQQRQIIGGIMENFVAIHLKYLNHDVCGWKKHSAGSEIDFIVKTSAATVPMECKASLKLKQSHLTGLKNYMRDYNLKTGIAITADKFHTLKFHFGNIINLPFYAIETLDLVTGFG